MGCKVNKPKNIKKSNIQLKPVQKENQENVKTDNDNQQIHKPNSISKNHQKTQNQKPHSYHQNTNKQHQNIHPNHQDYEDESQIIDSLGSKKNNQDNLMITKNQIIKSQVYSQKATHQNKNLKTHNDNDNVSVKFLNNNKDNKDLEPLINDQICEKDEIKSQNKSVAKSQNKSMAKSQNHSVAKQNVLNEYNKSQISKQDAKERLDSLTDMYENVVIKDDDVNMEQMMDEMENKYSAEEIEKIKQDKLEDLTQIVPTFMDLKDRDSIFKFCKGEFLQVLLQNKLLDINFIVYSWSGEPQDLYDVALELHDMIMADMVVFKDYNNKKMIQLIQEEMQKQVGENIKILREMELKEFKYQYFTQKFLEIMTESYQLIFQQYKKTRPQLLQRINDQYRDYVNRSIKIHEVNKNYNQLYRELLKNQKQLEKSKKNSVQVDWWNSSQKKTNMFLYLKNRYFDLQAKMLYEIHVGRDKSEQVNNHYEWQLDGDYIGGFKSKGLKTYYSSRFKKLMEGVQNQGDDVSVGNLSQMDQSPLKNDEVIVEINDQHQNDANCNK